MAYFDENDRPKKVAAGFAKATLKYDERGNPVEGAYFDEAGQPTRHKDGTPIQRHVRRAGNRIESAYFDR